MKKDAQPTSSPGIFDCVFPEWYSESKPFFETITRSFFSSDQVSEYSELMTDWGEILNTTLENWMRVSQKGLDIGKASLKQEEIDPEPLFEAVDSATREITESFEAFLKNSPFAPALEVVEAMKSSLRILEPEQDAFRNRMKKMSVFQLKIWKMTREWADRSWKDAQALNQNGPAWEDAVQEMISAQSELVRGMLDDLRLPEEVKSKSVPIADEYSEMMEKGLAVLVTGSNLMNRTWRAVSESWGEFLMPQNGKGDLRKDGFNALQSTLMFWPVAAETHLKTPAPAGRKTKGGSANEPAPAEAVVE